mmetsp:Transcript_13828/g.29055  ORF Transcript_13828/g.29055 Transcript_13828/m.29055 type:complete len:99 (-) Transcript_13828:24-320(-)
MQKKVKIMTTRATATATTTTTTRKWQKIDLTWRYLVQGEQSSFSLATRFHFMWGIGYEITLKESKNNKSLEDLAVLDERCRTEPSRAKKYHVIPNLKV